MSSDNSRPVSWKFRLYPLRINPLYRSPKLFRLLSQPIKSSEHKKTKKTTSLQRSARLSTRVKTAITLAKAPSTLAVTYRSSRGKRQGRVSCARPTDLMRVSSTDWLCARLCCFPIIGRKVPSEEARLMPLVNPQPLMQTMQTMRSKNPVLEAVIEAPVARSETVQNHIGTYRGLTTSSRREVCWSSKLNEILLSR